MSLPVVRQRLLDLMGETVADQARARCWFYHDVRPMPVPSGWTPGRRVTGDCSKGVQFLCYWAKAPDPMKNGYSVWGNSQTIWAALPATDRNHLEVGDLVVFGPDGKDHAAMVYRPGADPMLWSFGHQGAPNFYPLSADRRQSAFRKLMIDPLVGPDDAHLRALTGFWSWLSWVLGEGDWKGYGDANPAVRPNVPRKISKDWLSRRDKFVAARHTGNPPTTMDIV